jgi:ankyrin repeat protein
MAKLPEFLFALYTQGVITEDFYHKLQANIDAPDEKGNSLLGVLTAANALLDLETALSLGASFQIKNRQGQLLQHIAAAHGHSALIDFWVQQLGTDALSQTDNLSQTPLHLAAAQGHLGAVQHLLHIMPDVLATDYEDKNACLVAAINNKKEVLDEMLQDTRFQAQKQAADLYGRTLENCQAGLKDLSQKAIYAKITKYLANSHIKAIEKSNGAITAADLAAVKQTLKDTIKGNEQCDALSFMFLTQTKDAHYQMLTDVIDGDLKALHKDTNKAKYFAEFARKYLLLHDANMQTKQTYIAATGSGCEMRHNFSCAQDVQYNSEQLAEMYTMLASWRGHAIELTIGNGFAHEGKRRHGTALLITAQGTFDYYDPYFTNAIPNFTSAQDLVKHQAKFYFKRQGITDPFIVRFNVYKIYENSQSIPLHEKVRIPYPEFSPNGFNALHYAVFSNDIEQVTAAITHQPQAIAQKDQHNFTPMDWAKILGGDPRIQQALALENVVTLLKQATVSKAVLPSFSHYSQEDKVARALTILAKGKMAVNASGRAKPTRA